MRRGCCRPRPGTWSSECLWARGLWIVSSLGSGREQERAGGRENTREGAREKAEEEGGQWREMRKGSRARSEV